MPAPEHRRVAVVFVSVPTPFLGFSDRPLIGQPKPAMNHRRHLLLALGFSSCVLGAASASAQTLVPETGFPGTNPHVVTPFADTYETPRTMAMGLGARASATSTAGLAYNAAGLSIGRLYHIESLVSYEPQNERFAVGGALIDSHSGPVNAGVAFRYVHGNGHDGHGGYDGRVALGLPFGDAFAIGLTGRYLSYWNDAAQGDDAENAMLVEQFTFDASIRVTPLPGFHIAALGYNLLPTPSPLAPMQVGGSLSYTIDNTFTLAADGLADLSSWWDENGNIIPEGQFGGSAEFFTGEVPIRAGYFYDTGRDAHYLTCGSGWMNREIGIELSYRQQLNADQFSWLLLSVRYMVH